MKLFHYPDCLKKLYYSFRYVTSVLPSGGEDLRGDEAEKIVMFKNALGIDDPDAASMHMEVNYSYM